MGIKNLTKFLKDKYHYIGSTIHINDVLAYEKVAIDSSIYMYNFKYSYKDKWIEGFFKMISQLRRYNIHPVFIFDGRPPIEKTDECDERKKQRESMKKNLQGYETDIQIYKNSGIITPNLQSLNNQLATSIPTNSGPLACLFGPSRRMISTVPDSGLDLYRIEQKLDKMRPAIFDVTNDDFILLKDVLSRLHVPYYDAIEEAETMCADLWKKGLVKHVLTNDTDILAYGVDNLFSKLNIHTMKCTVYELENIIQLLQLDSMETFRDFCIMCGTDYNKNIPKVGPDTSLKLLQQYKNIDSLPSAYDTTILNHKRVRSMFAIEKSHVNIDYIPYNDIPSYDEVLSIIKEYKITSLNPEAIYKNFALEF